MNLAALIADKPLLASLSREYELLKATDAKINYEEWIKRRLQHAAAARAAQAAQQQGSTPAAETAPHQDEQLHQQQVQCCANQLDVRLRPTGSENIPRDAIGTSERSSSTGTWHLTGQRGAAEPALLPPAQQTWQAQDTTNTASRLPQRLQHSSSSNSGGDKNSSAAAAAGGPRSVPLWQPPKTSVNTRTQGRHPAAAGQPPWAVAARLQAALGSSGVAPLLKAAAERDQRLAAAAAAALARCELGSSSSISGAQQLLSSLHDSGMLRSQQLQQPELQQVVQLTQQVVAQNQLLQAALLRQQEQLQKHEGLLVRAPASSLETAAAAAGPGTTRVEGSAASAPHEQEQAGQEQHPLQPAAEGSSLLSQPQPPAAQSSCAPEQQQSWPGIAATGSPARPAPQRQQQLTSDRAALKAALKELLREAPGAVNGDPSRGGGGSSSNVQDSLVGLLQARAGRQQQLQDLLRDEEAAGRRSAACPGSAGQQQQRNQQQLLLERRQRGRQRELEHSEASIRRQQQAQEQQQQQRRRPDWSSDVFVPPPSHLLRRKHSGLADVWGLPGKSLPPVRPTSAGRPGSAAASSRRGTSSSGPTATRGRRRSGGAHGEATRSSRQARQWQGGPDRRTQVQQDISRSRSPQLSPSWAHLQPGSCRAVDAAGDAGDASWACENRGEAAAAAWSAEACGWPAAVAAAGGLATMTAAEVLVVEEAVQQQLEQEQARAEQERLLRLENTASHILAAIGRLEQQLQQQQPAGYATGAGKVAAGGDAAGLVTEPLVVSSLLQKLDRLEAEEAEIRQRWFRRSDAAAAGAGACAGAGAGTACLELRGGVLSLQPGVPPAAPQQVSSAVNAPAGSPAAGPCLPPADCAAAEAQPQQLTGRQEAAGQEQDDAGAISRRMLKSIKAGRQRFLKHQALVDGNLEVLDSLADGFSRASVTASSALKDPDGRAVLSDAQQQQRKWRPREGQQLRRALQPTAVVEAVADLLLDELLGAAVGDLECLCDELCSQLIEEEFL